MQQRYQPVLGVRPLRRLLIASIVGRLTLGSASLAQLLLVRASTHSYALAGICVGAFALAQAVVAPRVGRWLDRFGTVPVIATCATLQAVLLGLLAGAAGSGAPAALFLVLCPLIGASMPPVSSASRMLWHRLLPDPEERSSAFALDAIGQEFVWITGPVLVALVATTVSPRGAVVMVALVAALSAAWFLRAVRALPAPPEDPDPTDAGGPLGAFIRALAPVTVLMGAGLGATEVAMPALAGHIHHTSLSGLLLALWSLGSMLGGVGFGARVWSRSQERLLALLLGAGGLLVVPAMLSHTPLAALPASFVAGLCIAPIFSCTSSLIAEHAPPRGMARAFAANTSALVAGAAGGSALSGEVVAHAGVVAAFAVAGGLGLLAAALSATFLRGSHPEAPRPVGIETPVRV